MASKPKTPSTKRYEFNLRMDENTSKAICVMAFMVFASVTILCLASLAAR